ncbi:MAG: Methyltransferase type 12 [Gammaproteobacteria bacterium]|nr:MAG: Methyltransferase type 12 [Gammaproteobacteria bacterium]TND06451.1 MAG: Methyltransferase type 12 [Gammaproteobacteria bacterium]
MDDVNDVQSGRAQRGHGLAFFNGFLKRPEQVGSVIPSSRFLERRIIEVAEIVNARLVVELGPGTGGTTQAILDALPEDSRLLAIEISPEFVERLKAHSDPRLIVHRGSAEHIREALAIHGLSNPDVVISGIPFSTIPKFLGKRVISAVWSSLDNGGRFVAYQFRSRVASLGQELLGTPDTTLELLNVPPMRVYRWRKQADASR